MLVALLLTRAFAASPALFGAPVMITPLGMSGTDVKTGDVNGDGLLDVTVAAGDSYGWSTAGRGYSLELSLSDGAGGYTFTSVPTALLNGYAMVTDVADLDGDGLADLVASHNAGFSVFFSDGSTLATEVDYTGPRVGALELGDVDGDGDVDLLTLEDGGALNVYANDGAGAFTLVQALATTAGPSYDSEWDSIDLVDLDGDGLLDIVLDVANVYLTATEPIHAWLGDGVGPFSTTDHATTSGSPWMTDIYDVDLGDIDGDGLVDVVFAGPSEDVVSIPWDGGWGASTSWPIGTYAYNWTLVGDVDGDGDDDVVGTVGFDFGVLLQDAGALSDPGTVFPYTTTSSFAVSDDGYELVDMNGDGCEDIVTWVYGAGVTILPATSTGCGGAAPLAWGTSSGADTGDTGTADTASADTGAADTAGDTAGDTGDTSSDHSAPPPSSGLFSGCGVTDPRTGDPAHNAAAALVVAGLVLTRRKR